MAHSYWQKQTADAPLFPDLIWNRPENRLHAGKLLLVSGNSSGFALAAEAYAATMKAGIGVMRVLMPDSLARMVAKLFPEAEFAPSTPSGSFARESVAVLLEGANWADGVLLPGGLGKNSETAIAIESFLEKYHGQVTLAGDALEYALELPNALTRAQTIWVGDLAAMQKLFVKTKQPRALTSSLGLLEIVERLHDMSESFAGSLLLAHDGTTYVAHAGNISTTNTNKTITALAASAAVWHLQNPTKPFKALTSGIL